MKTSTDCLPEQKRGDLRGTVRCALEIPPNCEAVILCGSYTRSTYVDYDQRIECGIHTCFMSGYDISVVTSTRFQRYIINHILSKATDNYYKGKNGYVSTTVQFIDESIDDLNRAIDKNRYFYTGIRQESIVLYNSGRYRLARRHKPNYRGIEESVEEYYNDGFEHANSFLRSVRYSYKDQDYKIALFRLHQACENYYNNIILTFTLHSPKEHSLITLFGRAKTHSLESPKAFPQDTEEERRLFDLLQDAYVQARYNLHFCITKEDTGALIPKVE